MFVREANKQCFGFELTGFGEDAQVSTYHPGDHYDWHVDVGRQQPWRKVSVSIQLSADDAYSGGDLELQYGRVPKKMPREQGTVVVFPSFLLHRITPVTSGTRQSWLCGYLACLFADGASPCCYLYVQHAAQLRLFLLNLAGWHVWVVGDGWSARYTHF